MPRRVRKLGGIFYLCLTVFLQLDLCCGRNPVRREMRIPDLDGRVTLKCDFHMHTVFSDGGVWPDVRVQEAWQDGLDAVAITDHFEKHVHSTDIKADRNRSFDIAKKEGEFLGVIVIRGTEITRKMPPGHFNAIFIKDAEALNQQDWRTALASASGQGAFIFWNHPGWKGQQPDGIATWYKEHTEIYDKGWMHGIEVANYVDYYPQAQGWCNEKKLTLMGDSDAHDPMHMDFSPASGQNRPMTLVFSEERSEAGIREALFERRTAVFFNGDLFGSAEDLKILFEKSVDIQKDSIEISRNRTKSVPLTNLYDLDLRLVRNGTDKNYQTPEEIILPARCTALFTVKALADPDSGTHTVSFPYKIVNWRPSPEESLPISIRLLIKPVPNGT
jgi:3',5'-nucleoside bisphosphate phosphatase